MTQPTRQKVSFPNARALPLVGVLHRPAGEARGWALYAPCFTCSKDIPIAVRMCDALVQRGFAILRFDPTGLGESAGRFEDSDFDTLIDDVLHAAAWLEETAQAPQLLIGHSLGGAAMLEAAAHLPKCLAVVTLGTPAQLTHLAEQLRRLGGGDSPDGRLGVTLGGQTFTLSPGFVPSLLRHDPTAAAAQLAQALLILHAPQDTVVPYAAALTLFAAAREPRAFVSLDGADHLLRQMRDVEYCAELIAAWAARPLAQRF